MFVKLMKNEWAATWKVIILMNLFITIITVLGSASFYLRMWAFDSTRLLAVVCLFLYYLALAVICSAVCIYIAYRFYKNLYTDEGYLMHTLPVTPHQLLLSKTIVASIQLLFTFLVILLSVTVLFISGYHTLSTADAAKLYDTFYNEIVLLLLGDNKLSPVLFTMGLIFSFIIGSISSILMTYCAVSLGQLFSKHKLMASILCYFGLYMLIQMVSTVALIPVFAFSVSDEYAVSATFRQVISISIVVAIVFSAIFYFLSHYVMHKKLNLD